MNTNRVYDLSKRFFISSNSILGLSNWVWASPNSLPLVPNWSGRGIDIAWHRLFGAATFERRQLAVKVYELQTTFHPAGLGHPVRTELGLSPDPISKNWERSNANALKSRCTRYCGPLWPERLVSRPPLKFWTPHPNRCFGYFDLIASQAPPLQNESLPKIGSLLIDDSLGQNEIIADSDSIPSKTFRKVISDGLNVYSFKVM